MRGPVVPFLLAALLAAAAYLPRLGAPLVWDDRSVIVFNEALARPLGPRAFLTPEYFSVSDEQTWRPAATMSYHLMLRAFGPRPLPMRLAMLLLHLAVGLLLAYVLREAGLDGPAAWAASALFLVHPVHAETLMCVSFNEELLAALGLLGMLLAHARDRTGRAAAAFVFALLSKETGLAGLALVPLLDAARGIAGKRRSYALYAGIAAAYLAVRFGPLRGPGGEENLSALLPLRERLYHGAEEAWTWLRLLFLPAGLRLEYFALPPSSGWSEAGAWGGAAAALGLTAWLARRDRRAAFLALWPWAFFAFTSNLLPAGVLSLRFMAERWLYLPYLGACALLGRALARRRPVLAGALLACAALSAARAADWGRETRLWSSLVGVYPWSAKAWEGLGEARFRAGRYAASADAFEAAERLRAERRDLVLARYAPLTKAIGWESASLERWRGLAYLEAGDWGRAEGALLRAAALAPSDVFSRRVLAYGYARAGDFAAARAWLGKGFALDPADPFLRRLGPDVAAGRLTFRARF